jgi:hypothetical protein
MLEQKLGLELRPFNTCVGSCDPTCYWLLVPEVVGYMEWGFSE